VFETVGRHLTAYQSATWKVHYVHRRCAW